MSIVRREPLALLLAWPLLGCGPSIGSGDGEGTESGGTGSGSGSGGVDPSMDGGMDASADASADASTDEGVDEGSTGHEDTGEPTTCELAPLEVFDIEGLVGEPTVVQELEVLDSGEVVVAGYFGLARGNSTRGAFELVEAPALVSSSFVRLTRGSDRTLWVSAFDEVAHSPDAGDTWETWTIPHDALVHRVDVGGEERIYLGGDAILGILSGGESTWTTIAALDGDRGSSFESNMILSLVWQGNRLLAAERFGRLAGSADGEDWMAIEGPPLGDPELLDLGEPGLLLLSGEGEVFHSDDGSTWTARGLADTWPASASYATQLAYRAADGVLFAAGSDGLQVSCDLGASWVTLPLGTKSDVIYDVSVGADGSLWAAGFNEVFRVGP